MKNYLAVFLGKPEAMDKWRAMPEAERKQREQAGIEAWHKWVAEHKDAIVDMGSPLGKSVTVNKAGAATPTTNNLGGYSVLQGESKEALAKSLEGHPHFMMPDGFLEVVEIMPIPGM